MGSELICSTTWSGPDSGNVESATTSGCDSDLTESIARLDSSTSAVSILLDPTSFVSGVWLDLSSITSTKEAEKTNHQMLVEAISF